MPSSVHIVVIAGGSGTRFWPLSRRARPKQLLTLGGEEPLLAATFHRVVSLAPPERWWMVVGAPYADACRAVVPEVPAGQVLVEPMARNTAPAIGLAAVHLAKKDPDAVMVVLPSDHHVADTPAFVEAVNEAVAVAAQGPIVTLGISPTHPETGYGYIQRGERDARGHRTFQVLRFCEKPDLERAKGFLAQGGYEWNAGIFVMQARRVLAEIDRQLPAVGAALRSVQAAIGTDDYADRLREAFLGIVGISFDHGVMEGAKDVDVVPTRCGWSDVGSFSALGGIVDRDEAGNAVAGRAVSVDAKDCVLYAGPGQVVAALGVSGLAIIHSADATLVVPVERAQEVRLILDELNHKGWTEYL